MFLEIYLEIHVYVRIDIIIIIIVVSCTIGRTFPVREIVNKNKQKKQKTNMIHYRTDERVLSP